MAKQQTAAKAVKETVETTSVKPTTVVKEPKKPTWEIKDRTYYLKDGSTPLTFRLSSRHSKLKPLLYFDKEAGFQKEIRYATNQPSAFANEQKGEATMGHILFEEGVLVVPKEQQNLQKLLSIYHPHLNLKYEEFNAVVEAEDDLDNLELEFEAMSAARGMDVDQGEAILRVEKGSEVSSMSSKELKRDLLLFARGNPALFLELANDENVHLRNIAIKATENGIISLSDDNRTFNWASNNRKLMTVPFDENPYSAMAAFFKTDEGLEVFRSVEKKLN
tara:strand:+ start:802 stop:1632 length:831 start_codon:yes stop_codon:yes gene_type:complete